MSNNDFGDCAGCKIALTLDNMGGFQDYCEKCVGQVMGTPFPDCGKGFVFGKFPNIRWIDEKELNEIFDKVSALAKKRGRVN